MLLLASESSKLRGSVDGSDGLDAMDVATVVVTDRSCPVGDPGVARSDRAGVLRPFMLSIEPELYVSRVALVGFRGVSRIVAGARRQVPRGSPSSDPDCFGLGRRPPYTFWPSGRFWDTRAGLASAGRSFGRGSGTIAYEFPPPPFRPRGDAHALWARFVVA
jgi:hypothetical protein